MTDSSYEHYETDHEIGQDNIEVLGMDVHNPVFITSALLIILFVTTTIVFPAAVNAALSDIKSWFLTTFDWFLMASASGMLLFCLVLCVLPVSRIRLGGGRGRSGLLSHVVVFYVVRSGHGYRLNVLGRCRAYGVLQRRERHTTRGKATNASCR